MVTWYTYVLLSLKDHKFYIGYTNGLKSRYAKHSTGLVEATKNRRPLIIVYYEACLNQQDAITREKYLKTGYGRNFLKGRLKGFSNTPNWTD